MAAAHAVPDWLEPVLAFVNTIDVEDRTDTLADGPAALGAWLAARGLLAEPAAAATRADHRLALDLRAGLRALALQNNGHAVDEPGAARLRRALARLPLVVTPTPGGPEQAGLRAHRLPPVRAALASIVAGYARGVATGQWSRIRRCPADDCAWVFWDTSAKGTRRWCTMRVCGNRAKARTYAARRAAARAAGPTGPAPARVPR